MLTAALTQQTERLKFLVAFRPGLLSPTLAAQMAATYQRISGGRLLLNVVVGGDDAEQRRFGDFLGKDERYARAGEFLTSCARRVEGEPVDFDGDHVQVEGAQRRRPAERPGDLPRRLLPGRARGRRQPRRRLPHLGRAARAGRREARPRARGGGRARARELRFGIRLHVDRARHGGGGLGGGRPAAGRARPRGRSSAPRRRCARRSRRASGGWSRCTAAAPTGSRSHPNLWAGVGLVRGGAGTALVGSHEEVADRIAEYHELGIDEFILSGYPHLEEAYRVGEGVVPVLRRRGLLGAPADRAVAAVA